ncbi:FadR/GntR family transcriptional regulator [Streptomyces sp. 7-21]|jgi:GntR family transcriptional repressor for pyruvate dehydrogenase complex|uniref:FadR/GntR family transcriptional regulator n=1 Tax=Streptomyces sp. 7-21 TaxID=2802283 RepID=UPI00191EF669|nr:FadR/GntR family transcriptional regulator [Streptomyces sp. 7-21]MBL1066879.1 FadR family transcriptional regulator [Streptomyces sp. 7-21]
MQASQDPVSRNRHNTGKRQAARPPRLSEVVAEQIQRDLLSQGMKPGDRLPTEPQLVERYGVSRTVIREAGRILDQRGLVDIRPGRGMVVAQPDGSAVARHYALMLGMNVATFQQLMETRLLVEVEVAALAAERRSEEDLRELRACVDRARQHPGDYTVCLEADIRFHEVVTRASGNPFFSWFMDPVNTCLRQSYKDAFRYLASLPQTLEEHGAILAAIEARDPEEARRASRVHLMRVMSERNRLLAGDGDGDGEESGDTTAERAG